MAQTLKFGKGTWATKTGSSMAYNDQSGNYKPLPFNVERDSIATRVNKEGLIEVVGKDKLRIDYTDSAKGVALLENSSTNLFEYSEDFSNSYWAKSGNAVVDSELTISPSGKQNASKFTFDGTTNATVNRTVSVTNGVAYTFSVWLKNNNLSDSSKVWIGLSTTTQGEYVTVTNEWQRFDTTHTSNGTLEYPRVQTSEVGSIFAWGAMLEQNSFATSYIPTSGSTVQRQADVVNGSGNSEVFNDSEGVLFADIASNSDTTTAYNSIGIGSNSSNNRISIGFDASSNLYVFKRTTTQWLSNTSNDIKLYNKIAISYNTNDNHFWLNGFKIDSDTTIGDLSTKPNELGFEATFGGNNFYGKTKEIGYYDATLTDSELEYLTSYRSLNELVTELNLNTL